MTGTSSADITNRAAGSRSNEQVIADSTLIERLAHEVLHWRTAPGRFLTGNRSWRVRWKFNPLAKIEDAFKLIDAAEPTSYTISLKGDCFFVEVQVKGKIGKASGASRPRTIVMALARSLNLGGPEA